ncbi:hypothetical protein NHJ13734_009098 [Beauveria thailandica]
MLYPRLQHVPLSLSVPAALGAAVNLNARSSLWYDTLMLGGILRGVAGIIYGGRVGHSGFWAKLARGLRLYLAPHATAWKLSRNDHELSKRASTENFKA